MNISPLGISLIKYFEGFSAEPYRCPAGYWTIGYGHLIPSLEQEKYQMISEVEAEELLRQDVARTEATVRRLIPVALSQGQFDALVSFTYNLGAGALQRSALRQKARRGEHKAAAAEFSRWIYAGGKRLPGLVKRRAAEEKRYQGIDVIN